MQREFDIRNTSRRAFLTQGTLVLLSASAATHALGQQPGAGQPRVRAALMTDLHYADKKPGGSRHYREAIPKLQEAVDNLGDARLDFAVELGDLIDAADSVATEQGYLKRINSLFVQLSADRHYVLGNHCVYTLTKQEFLDGVEKPRSYYSFDKNGFHFIVLDACFRGDGQPYGRQNFEWTDPNLSAEEIDWLKEDLARTDKKTMVFVHQRLDVDNHHGIKNAVQARQLLEQSGKVLAVFQGHSHQNDYHAINGIHYCTLVAMVEGSGDANNAYCLLELFDDATIFVRGFRKQKDYSWNPRP